VFFGGGLVGIILLALWLWAIFDVISTDNTLVRNLPKIVWLLLVIVIPTIGAIAWLLLGRPERAGWRPGTTIERKPPRILGPEDSPQFMSALEDEATRLRRWEDELRKREDDLRRREDGDQGTE
jgi:hypothetical protein